MDTQLVLNVTNVDTAVALVIDEHGKSASVLSAFFRTGQHKVDVGVTVGDESLHAIEAPGAVGILRGLEHHALQVAAGIGLGEVHTHGLACANARNILLALLLRTKLVECVDTALKAPYILEAGISCGNNLREHGEHAVGDVETTVAAWHGDTPQAGLACSVEVLIGLACIFHSSVLKMRTFKVHALRIGLDDVGCHIACDIKQTLVVLNGVFKTYWGISEVVLVGIVALFQVNDALHQRMSKIKSYFRMITIIICHYLCSCKE